MFGVILSILFHPYVWIAAVIIAAVLAGIYFINPVTFWKVVTNVKLWLALAVLALFLAYANVEKDTRDLRQQVAQASQQHTADKDATTVTQTRVVQKTKRAAQTSRIQDKIDHAQPGQAEDAALDAIAAERSGGGGGSPDVGLPKRPDGVAKP
jgi:membrane protein implicated in regulation of membrane protease activity